MNPTATVARLAGVSKRYGTVQALQQIDLEVRRGEVHALLGPNGAGKTTAVSLLLGLLAPDAGDVSLLTAAADPGGAAPLRRDAADRRRAGNARGG
jgi:ABC-type multidrug transport system ATPase subunit